VIRKGEYIIDGNPDPHDILRIQGIEALAVFLVDEVQEVYRLQGVPINDKHIEVIVRQMLQKVEVIDPGETGLIRGDHLDKPEFEAEQAKVRARGAARPPPSRSCWASPRRRSRPTPSSPRRASRRPRASSPTPRSTARSTTWRV
jgi:DNA-directed RNA polymerase subunit beta'